MPVFRTFGGAEVPQSTVPSVSLPPLNSNRNSGIYFNPYRQMQMQMQMQQQEKGRGKELEEFTRKEALNESLMRLVSNPNFINEVKQIKALPASMRGEKFQELRKKYIDPISALANPNYVNSNILYNALLKPLELSAKQEHEEKTKDPYSAIIPSLQKGAYSLWGTIKNLLPGTSVEEIAKEQTEFKNRINSQNPYLQYQEERARAGESLWDRTEGLGGFLNLLAEAGPNLLAFLAPGGVVGGLARGLGAGAGAAANMANWASRVGGFGIGSSMSDLDYATRVTNDPNLTEEQKQEALNSLGLRGMNIGVGGLAGAIAPNMAPILGSVRAGQPLVNAMNAATGPITNRLAGAANTALGMGALSALQVPATNYAYQTATNQYKTPEQQNHDILQGLGDALFSSMLTGGLLGAMTGYRPTNLTSNTAPTPAPALAPTSTPVPAPTDVYIPNLSDVSQSNRQLQLETSINPVTSAMARDEVSRLRQEILLRDQLMQNGSYSAEELNNLQSQIDTLENNINATKQAFRLPRDEWDSPGQAAATIRELQRSIELKEYLLNNVTYSPEERINLNNQLREERALIDFLSRRHQITIREDTPNSLQTVTEQARGYAYPGDLDNGFLDRATVAGYNDVGLYQPERQTTQSNLYEQVDKARPQRRTNEAREFERQLQDAEGNSVIIPPYNSQEYRDFDTRIQEARNIRDLKERFVNDSRTPQDRRNNLSEEIRQIDNEILQMENEKLTQLIADRDALLAQAQKEFTKEDPNIQYALEYTLKNNQIDAQRRAIENLQRSLNERSNLRSNEPQATTSTTNVTGSTDSRMAANTQRAAGQVPTESTQTSPTTNTTVESGRNGRESTQVQRENATNASNSRAEGTSSSPGQEGPVGEAGQANTTTPTSTGSTESTTVRGTRNASNESDVSRAEGDSINAIKESLYNKNDAELSNSLGISPNDLDVALSKAGLKDYTNTFTTGKILADAQIYSNFIKALNLSNNSDVAKNINTIMRARNDYYNGLLKLVKEKKIEQALLPFSVDLTNFNDRIANYFGPNTNSESIIPSNYSLDTLSKNLVPDFVEHIVPIHDESLYRKPDTPYCES